MERKYSKLSLAEVVFCNQTIFIHVNHLTLAHVYFGSCIFSIKTEKCNMVYDMNHSLQ